MFYLVFLINTTYFCFWFLNFSHNTNFLGFKKLFILLSDPRTNNWLLMSSPFPTLAICLSYVYLVKVLGPRLMENRKPMDLRYVLIVYNLFQVLFSTWLFYEVNCICLCIFHLLLVCCTYFDVSYVQKNSNL